MSAAAPLDPLLDPQLEGLLAEAKGRATADAAAVADPPAANRTAGPDTAPAGGPSWPGGTSGAKPAIQKVAYSHEAMIDLILANPGISQNAIARHFGYTPSWVCQVMQADAFQMAFAARRAQIVDPALMLTVEQNFKALVARSLDILQQKLNKPADEIPDQLALRAFEISSRVAGYGHNDQPQLTARQEVHVHLEELGSGLVALLHRKKVEANVSGALSPPTIEGDFTDDTPNSAERIDLSAGDEASST